MSTEATSSNYLKVLGKAFSVIGAMAEARNGVRISDLSRQLRQPKATVFRILFTLTQLGYVEQDPQNATYHLTGRASWSGREGAYEALKRASRPFMGRLLALFEETVSLVVLEQAQVYYLEILEGTRAIRMAAAANTYAPVHATALGKSILAFLEPGEAERILSAKPLRQYTDHTITSIDVVLYSLEKEVRRRGYAVDNEETEIGARCVGAPIFDSEGRPFAAISVSGSSGHISGKKVGEIGRELKEVTTKISARLGMKPVPKGPRKGARASSSREA